MRKKYNYIPNAIVLLSMFVFVLFIMPSCSPKSIKPTGSELFFSLEYVPKLKKYTDESRFKYKDGRVTDKFIPSGEYGQVIPYIGRFYHEYHEYMPVFGFTDADGCIITDAIYPVLDTFTLADGTELFIAECNHMDSAVIPQNGMWMIEFYGNRYSFPPKAYDNGLFGIVNDDLDTQIYNSDGVLQRVIDNICVYYGNNLCVIRSDISFPPVYRLQDPDGGYINDINYYNFSGFRSGYASVSIKTSPVKREYSAAVIDTSGNYVIGPTIYQRIDADTIDIGVMRVLDKDNKYGIIDIDGNELVPCQYPHLTIESASPLIFTTNNKRINHTEGTEAYYDPAQEHHNTTPDYGGYDYRTTICGYTCAVLDEYTYVFDPEGELLFKKLIHDTD